jgi:NAD(P)-dependent dehydrogenase (short-subunit alcohol dehydrogenase family)
LRLAGKSVVVTGGARGIGLASVRALLARDARVTIVARSRESVDEAVARLDPGAAVTTVAADLTTGRGCRAMAAAALESCGTIDALFTNAGVYSEAAVEEVDEDGWTEIVDANLKSTFFSIQAALPALRRSRGAIVTMSSYHGLVGVPGVSVYGAAKAGVVGLTRSLALELAPTVRVNCIAPGYVETEKLLAREDREALTAAFAAETPVGRVGRSDEIAAALLFALESEFLNGAVLSVDGGRCAGPWTEPNLPQATTTG